MLDNSITVLELQSLASLSKSKSLSIAADMLCLNQGELLLRIQMLQLKLGVKLFQRHGRLISLTKEGFSFATSSSSVMAMLEAAAEQMGVAQDVIMQFKVQDMGSQSKFAFRRKRRNMTAPRLAAIIASSQEAE